MFKTVIKVVLIFYVVGLLIGSGYYFSQCSCAYKFFVVRPKFDCANMCADLEPMEGFEKVVNLVLLKK